MIDPKNYIVYALENDAARILVQFDKHSYVECFTWSAFYQGVLKEPDLFIVEPLPKLHPEFRRITLSPVGKWINKMRRITV